jgi:hypothetical protein
VSASPPIVGRSLLAIVAAALLVGGCTHPKRWFSNRSLVRDTVVKLPGDGAIFVEIEQTESFGHPSKRQPPRYVWEQPGRETKVLNVTGERPADMTTNSLSSRLSGDGNIAELLANGRVIATFNYTAGTARFAP